MIPDDELETFLNTFGGGLVPVGHSTNPVSGWPGTTGCQYSASSQGGRLQKSVGCYTPGTELETRGLQEEAA